MRETLKKAYEKYREVFWYLVFGGLTTAVNYGVYAVMTRGLGAELVASNIVAWIAAVLFAYFTNRRWVFRSRSAGAAMVREMGGFFAARLFSGVLDTILMVALVEWMGLNDMIAKIPVNVVVILVNYVLSKLIVFRKKGTGGT